MRPFSEYHFKVNSERTEPTITKTWNQENTKNEKWDADCEDLIDTKILNHSSTLIDTETGSTIWMFNIPAKREFKINNLEHWE
jgi:hypothetical protein